MKNAIIINNWEGKKKKKPFVDIRRAHFIPSFVSNYYCDHLVWYFKSKHIIILFWPLGKHDQSFSNAKYHIIVLDHDRFKVFTNLQWEKFRPFKSFVQHYVSWVHNSLCCGRTFPLKDSNKSSHICYISIIFNTVLWNEHCFSFFLFDD